MRAVVAAVVGLMLCTTPAAAQLENVGNLSFPTSALARGAATLPARSRHPAQLRLEAGDRRVQAAQKLQPDFAMAYWGETLCYNHPLNAEQDAKNPRAMLARLGPDRPRGWPRRRRRVRRDSCRRSRSCGPRAPTGAPGASPT